jgi:hypothetical protein
MMPRIQRLWKSQYAVYSIAPITRIWTSTSAFQIATSAIFANVPQLGWRAAKKIVAAHRTTPLADEGLIPLSVLPLVTGVIVPPDRNKKKNERERSDYKVDLYRK